MANINWSTTENRWICKIQIDGVRKKFTSTKPGLAGKREVSRKLSAFLSGESVNNKKFADVWASYLAETLDRLGRGEMYKQIEMYGRLYILPMLGAKKIEKIKLDEFQKVISLARPIKNPDGELSKKSLMTLRSVLMAFINYAVAHQLMEPLRGQLYIPAGHYTKGREILQPDAIASLFEPSDEHYVEALRFMLVTGLRPGECLGLQWDDVEGSVLSVRRSLNFRGVVTDGKNKNARREFVLPGIALEILNRQKEKTSHLDSDWIFCSSVGGRPTQDGVYDCYKRLAALHGFGGSPYSLRHTFVSMIKNDVPLEMIKSIVGHSASMDTMGVYGHRVTGEMESAAKVIDLSLAAKIKKSAK